MSDINQTRQALITRVLDGAARTPRSQRRAAFDNAGLGPPVRTLVEKIAMCAYNVTDEDIAAARISGLSEDAIFEIVICAAIGQAARAHDAALAALDAAAEGS